MGLGDEILALGRIEKLFEQTGEAHSIFSAMGYPREHDAWIGNPAWLDARFTHSRHTKYKIIDGGGVRPYIDKWYGDQIIFNMDHRPHAGRIWLTESEKNSARNAVCGIGDYAVVAPVIKDIASPNKSWGVEKWEAVIAGLPLPVFQLMAQDGAVPIRGARALHTAHFRQAAAVIARSKLVLCNEGGSHHMAASMRTPAVVIFGSFIPPQVTGYDFHTNISVETPHGYCGKFTECADCKEALESITIDDVLMKALDVLREKDMKKECFTSVAGHV